MPDRTIADRGPHDGTGPAGSAKLAFHGVAKSYLSRGQEVRALEPFDLGVERHSFVAIVGPSGCGKSTLLHIAAGLTRPTGGEVRVDGRLVRGPGRDRGIVFQHFALYPAKTVAGNVDFGLRVAGYPAERRRTMIAELIVRMGLGGFENHYPNQLSGGMQQRVAIARAIALQPEILLMDEPFGALDAQTRILMQEDIARLCAREELTVLFVTHSVEEAVFLADRVIVMTARPGRIKEEIEVASLAEWRGEPVDSAYRSPVFTELRERVWRSVRQEIGSLGPTESTP
ncbi:MAG: ABC transporter ATP-binding protein [Chloroflexota bacterium]